MHWVLSRDRMALTTRSSGRAIASIGPPFLVCAGLLYVAPDRAIYLFSPASNVGTGMQAQSEMQAWSAVFRSKMQALLAVDRGRGGQGRPEHLFACPY
jgi:hypothetical protein